MAVINIGKGAHWRGEIQKAFESFRKKEMNLEITKQLSLHCENILLRAIKFRLEHSHTDGHDYTGNLINSIVVILYDEGEIVDVWSAGDKGQIRKPIARKMSARKKPYYFFMDYSHTKSHYKAELETNKGLADADVLAFVNGHKPSVTKGFCIAVGYTVEYASWVEYERGTTGYLQTYHFAGKEIRSSFKQIGKA